MLEDLITQAEIERSRSPTQFVAWFDAFLESTRVDRSNREQILLRRGIAKPVYEEVFPLYRLLGHKQNEWKDRLFQNVLGNQSHDVIVTVPSSPAPQFIEITVADVNEAEMVRMEAFVANGRVPAISPVTWSGNRRTGRNIQISEGMVPLDRVVQKKKQQVIDAIMRKSKQTYKPETSLLVYFDDYTAFADTNDQPLMEEMMAMVYPIWKDQFCALYVVGASGRIYWERKS